MPSSWGSEAWPADGNGHWQAGVAVERTALSDSAATYRLTCLYRTWWGYQVHSTWSLWADDGAAKGNHLDASGPYELAVSYGQQREVAALEVSFERRDGDYTAWFGASFRQHGGYGDGYSEALMALTVPARPRYPPAAPSILSAGRDASGGVELLVSVNSGSATAMQVARQRSGDASWETVYDGAPAPSVLDAPGAGTWRYRARNGNADGWSAWGAETAWLSGACAPAAPTPASPQSGAVVDAASQPLELSWTHNPKDGSAQTKAEVRTSLDGGATWEAHEVAGASGALRLSFDPGSSVAWDVRTAGVSGEWGPRGAQRRFSVYARPRVEVAPVEVDRLPFEVSWGFEDGWGSQAFAEVAIADAAGRRVFEASVQGPAASVEVPPGRFTPRDGEAYAVAVAARSTTGLAGSGSSALSVAYAPPEPPSLSVEVDPAAGSALLRVDAVAGDVDTDSISVWRGDSLVRSGMSGGQACIDALPPLDVPLEYRAVSYAPSGAAAETAARATVPSGSRAHFNWGAGWAEHASMALNMRPSESYEPEVETLLTPGRDLPVSVYGRHTSASGSLSCDVWWSGAPSSLGEEGSLGPLRALAANAGDAAMRLPLGERRRVSARVGIERGSVAGVATATVEWTEVDGGLD